MGRKHRRNKAAKGEAEDQGPRDACTSNRRHSLKIAAAGATGIRHSAIHSWMLEREQPFRPKGLFDQ
jgi:hypothetical protein